MNNISKLIKALNAKFDVYKNDLNVADVSLDGLLDKSEASAMITGIVGGKGPLPDGTNLDEATHGGVYYLPKDRTYAGIPFTSPAGKYRGQLTVIRNHGGNAHTDDPLIFQEFRTVNLIGSSFVAYRYCFGSKWLEWHYPSGKVIWDGEATATSSITLTESLANFASMEIYWRPYGLPTRSQKFTVNQQPVYTLHAINIPNNVNDSNPAVSVEEINLSVNTDKTVLTGTHSAFYIQNGVTIASDIDAAQKTKIIAIKGYTEI